MNSTITLPRHLPWYLLARIESWITRSFKTKVDRDCPICCGPTVTKHMGLLSATSYNVKGIGPKNFDLVCCSECDLIFLTPLPPEKAFEALYIRFPQFVGHPAYHGENARMALQFYRDRLAEISDVVAAGREFERVLDIGSGLSLIALAAKLLDHRTIAVAQDISQEAAELCPWVDHYLVGPLESKEEEIQRLGPFDLISMTHVIEHLPNPIQVLRLCANWLSERGTIFVTAPSRPVGWNDSSSFEMWKKWEYNHTPAHLQYFNGKSMRQCCLRSGLHLLKYERDKDSFVAWLGSESKKSA